MNSQDSVTRWRPLNLPKHLSDRQRPSFAGSPHVGRSGPRGKQDARAHGSRQDRKIARVRAPVGRRSSRAVSHGASSRKAVETRLIRPFAGSCHPRSAGPSTPRRSCQAPASRSPVFAHGSLADPCPRKSRPAAQHRLYKALPRLEFLSGTNTSFLAPPSFRSRPFQRT